MGFYMAAEQLIVCCSAGHPIPYVLEFYILTHLPRSPIRHLEDG